jgi:hypothetical protein
VVKVLYGRRIKKNKDSLNGLVVDHENDVKQKKSTINRPCCFMSKWICNVKK